MSEGGGVGETSSSRHCGVFDCDAFLARGRGPVGVVSTVDDGAGATDWKAWMGRASKNSWAKMNGVFEGSITSDQRNI